MNFSRNDQSLIASWWWTVDRWSLAAILGLIAFGMVLTLASSPSVAIRLGAGDSFFFVRHQLMLLPLAGLSMFGASLLSPRDVRRLALLLLVATIAMLLLTPLFGTEIKGARRWLSLGGFSLQPSEFVKPAIIIVTAWLLSVRRRDPNFPGYALAIGLVGLVVVLLLAQPDLGQTVVISFIWLWQLFLAGLPLWTLPALGGMTVCGGFAAYFTLPHVKIRIDKFLDPTTGDTWQIDRSIQAFTQGGLFGKGPGGGGVKQVLPDAHADFVFAVAGEELGIIACAVIVLLFATIVMRGLSSALKETSLFALLATAGLAAEFGLQALINMSSSLALIPTKGMTLPFLSYGGSSLLAISLSVGCLLALTRRRPGPPEEP